MSGLPFYDYGYDNLNVELNDKGELVKGKHSDVLAIIDERLMNESKRFWNGYRRCYGKQSSSMMLMPFPKWSKTAQLNFVKGLKW